MVVCTYLMASIALRAMVVILGIIECKSALCV